MSAGDERLRLWDAAHADRDHVTVFCSNCAAITKVAEPWNDEGPTLEQAERVIAAVRAEGWTMAGAYFALCRKCSER